MSAGWVAASVRARATARRRLGLAAVRRLRAAGSLEAALGQLESTAYARATGAGDLAEAQHAVAAAVLWQVRVLAGWMPASGALVARTLAGAFERENLCDHLRRLHTGRGAPGREPFDLGALSSAWNRARRATTPAALRAELAASPWGDLPVEDLAAFRDATAGVWLRRLLLDVPGSAPVAVAGAVLLVARARAVEGRAPSARLVTALDGVIGTRWPAATTLEDLHAALDPAAGRTLDGVTAPDGLRRAEAAGWQLVADTGLRLLRDPLPGPERVVGAVAVLAADAFRVRAALADAATGGGEVLDGVA